MFRLVARSWRRARNSSLRAPPSKRPRLLPPIAVDLDGSEMASDVVHVLGQTQPFPKQGVIEDLQERVSRLEKALVAQGAAQNGRSPSDPTVLDAPDSDGIAFQCQPPESFSISSQVRKFKISRLSLCKFFIKLIVAVP